mmetsp:Transcript_13943/g.38318  ORF Transcript_13943/g.38318 Transcript_13943/m.38318 type:complete len:235 (-) Transcript_13943:40-744(-)
MSRPTPSKSASNAWRWSRRRHWRWTARISRRARSTTHSPPSRKARNPRPSTTTSSSASCPSTSTRQKHSSRNSQRCTESSMTEHRPTMSSSASCPRAARRDGTSSISCPTSTCSSTSASSSMWMRTCPRSPNRSSIAMYRWMMDTRSSLPAWQGSIMRTSELSTTELSIRKSTITRASLRSYSSSTILFHTTSPTWILTHTPSVIRQLPFPSGSAQKHAACHTRIRSTTVSCLC